ncbi:N-acetyltransferase [Martelella sp. FOR1707]
MIQLLQDNEIGMRPLVTWAFSLPGEDTERLATLVANRIWPGADRCFGNCRGIAVAIGDELAAGLIYHNYDPDAGVIEISGASWRKGWLTKSVLRAMYGYPFRDCGCQAVVQRVSDADKAQHRMLKAFGAEHYRIPRLRGRDEAENIFLTTKEAWEANSFPK